MNIEENELFYEAFTLITIACDENSNIKDSAAFKKRAEVWSSRLHNYFAKNLDSDKGEDYCYSLGSMMQDLGVIYEEKYRNKNWLG